MALRKFLVMGGWRSGRSEGRAALIQRFVDLFLCRARGASGKCPASRRVMSIALIASTLWLSPVAVTAENKQTAREQVGKPVQAAEQLLKQKKYQEALAKLAEADAVANKTPYEVYVIEGTRAVAYLESGDHPAAIKALDAVLSTGMLPPAEALKRVEIITQLRYQTKDYPGVVASAERYYREGGKDEEPRLLMAQAYYLQGDFANAAKTSRAMLLDHEKAGKPTSEAVLQMLVNSEFKQQNHPGYVDALQQLVAAYPKPQYWRQLLSAIERKPGFAARFALDIDRLMVATGAMDAPGQYLEAAQLALEAGLPGDAKSILDKGYAVNLLGKGAGAERQQRLAAMASRQSNDDLKGLPNLAKEADAAATGLAWVKLGEAYASYGRYDDAIAAFQKGIAKGGLKYPEDAKLHLGIAYLQAKQPAKAKEVLSALAAGDGAQDLGRLWLIAAGVR
jgi:tetratricopeptide (TPR) repeat protein